MTDTRSVDRELDPRRSGRRQATERPPTWCTPPRRRPSRPPSSVACWSHRPQRCRRRGPARAAAAVRRDRASRPSTAPTAPASPSTWAAAPTPPSTPTSARSRSTSSSTTPVRGRASTPRAPAPSSAPMPTTPSERVAASSAPRPARRGRPQLPRGAAVHQRAVGRLVQPLRPRPRAFDSIDADDPRPAHHAPCPAPSATSHATVGHRVADTIQRALVNRAPIEQAKGMLHGTARHRRETRRSTCCARESQAQERPAARHRERPRAATQPTQRGDDQRPQRTRPERRLDRTPVGDV